MTGDIKAMRRAYKLGGIDVSDVLPDPIEQFQEWFQAARQAGPPDWLEINAMTLATADRQGNVTSRIVLLKSVQGDGFTFFTNYQSIKGRQLADNPQASLCFFWPHLERQVRIDGTVQIVSESVSDEYFQSRPRDSQLGALLSEQSAPVADRATLETRFEALRQEHQDRSIARPKHWGGYRVQPQRIEFWQGRPNRIHDRICYARQQDVWTIERLCP